MCVRRSTTLLGRSRCRECSPAAGGMAVGRPRPRSTQRGRSCSTKPGRLAVASGFARGGLGCDGPTAPRRDSVPRGRARVVSAVDRAVVHGQSPRGRLCGLVGAVHPRGRGILAGGGEDAVTGLDVLLAVAGAAVTLLVIVGMILITPRGQVDIAQDAPSSQGSDLSRAGGTDAATRVSTNA